MMVGLIVRAASSASNGGSRQPVKRQPKTYTPGHARLALAGWLGWVVFITVIMLTCPMSP